MAWSRGRPGAVRGLRLAHPAGRRRQRRRRRSRRRSRRPSPTTGRASSPSGPTSASAARTSRTARRRTARRSGVDEVRLTKEALRLGSRIARSTCPTRRAALFRAAIPAGEALVADWEARFYAYRDGAPATPRREFRRRIAGRPARRLGRRPHDLRDRHGGRDPEREPGRDRGPRAAAPRAVRRRRRPVRIEPDRRQGRAELQRRRGRPEPALRGPRARDGRRRQRHRLSRRVHPVLRHVPDVQRLHARRRSGWRRCPGSTSSTSGRTTRSASARTVRPTSRSSTTRPCGRSRTCGSSGPATPTRPRPPGPLRDRADRRPGRAGPDPPEAADPARHRPPRPRGCRAGRLRPARGLRRDAAADHDRDRFGAPARVRRRRGARGRGHPDARRVAAVLGAVRGPGPGLPRRGAAAGRAQAGQRRGRRRRSAGSAGSATRARSSGSITSAPRRRPARSSSSFGFTAERVTDVGRRVVPRGPPRPDPDPRRRALRPLELDWQPALDHGRISSSYRGAQDLTSADPAGQRSHAIQFDGAGPCTLLSRPRGREPRDRPRAVSASIRHDAQPSARTAARGVRLGGGGPGPADVAGPDDPRAPAASGLPRRDLRLRRRGQAHRSGIPPGERSGLDRFTAGRVRPGLPDRAADPDLRTDVSRPDRAS